ncbi:hypothetical protein BK732_07325 [Bacillus thuringiensis serovar navarrensis]|uniref:Branched-chain amino acid ABC transporter substrate-binding protein n=2 Tax=Bacillus cereus group TaxID=86661 RepID=A0A243AJN5_BACTU|nr:hypothetical protein [Bacillus thuringiensis]OTY24838.1 hypothetical protein BK732_07325 [Bacillus thuringiensis serovar navarrensis]
MKKIQDERLILQNLNNIKIIYIVQTLSIIGILGYDLITKGFDGMKENPLWYLLLLTAIISAYLSMNISTDEEKEIKSPKKQLFISLFVVSVISLTIGSIIVIKNSILDGLIVGFVLFVSSLIPVIYVYKLRIKKNDD